MIRFTIRSSKTLRRKVWRKILWISELHQMLESSSRTRVQIRCSTISPETNWLSTISTAWVNGSTLTVLPWTKSCEILGTIDGPPLRPNPLLENQDRRSPNLLTLSLMQSSSLTETKVSNLHLKAVSKSRRAILNFCSESLKTCPTMIRSLTWRLWTWLFLETLRIKRLCS